MDNFDFFELVGLSFDPPETNIRSVTKKIEQKQTELGSVLGRETQATRRNTIQEQLKFLEEITAKIISPDGKKVIKSAMDELATKKVEAEERALAGTAALLAQTGDRTITESALRHYKQKSKLDMKRVKKIFTDAGFEIVKMEGMGAYPKFPTNADRIYANLAALRGSKDPNPNAIDPKVAEDLFSFVAYISQDIANLPMYRNMDTKELWSICDQASKRYSQRNDDLGKLLGEISSAAKMYVFNSDENREAYKLHLKYCCEELTNLFATMKMVTEEDLLSDKFAETCIKKISKYFPNYETALAIYNKEAGFVERFYEPKKGHYVVQCKFCDAVNEFSSEAEATASNACKNCKKPLFKKCTKCGKLVAAVKDVCPHCQFHFDGTLLFAKYYQQAETAFRKNDFDTAREMLFKAESADPGEKNRVNQLRMQIDKEESVRQKPIAQLKKLESERKFMTARQELAAILSKFPGMNMKDFEQRIAGEISKAERRFEAARSYTPSQKANECIAILMQCVDYTPALSFLRATPPLPCPSIAVTPSAGNGVIGIGWKQTAEQGITYRLVRKNGKMPPTSENDGTVLADKSTATSYVDESAKAGVVYTYGVFAVRQGVFSSVTAASTMLYTEVKNCTITQRGGSIRLTWDDPENSRGASVERLCCGERLSLIVGARGCFDDTNVEYGKAYTYRVYANYDGNQRSGGIEKTITLVPTIESFSIRGNKGKDNDFTLSWSIRQGGIALRVLVNGNRVAVARSEDRQAVIPLPPETFCTVQVQAQSGGKWIESDNSLEVNTYSAYTIDKKATQIEEEPIPGQMGSAYINLMIHLAEQLRPNVSGFYYAVRTAQSGAKWAEKEDIGNASDIQFISANAYRSKGYILYRDIVKQEGTFYISVFTCHSIRGETIISDPQKMKIDRIFNGNLFWALTYGMFDGLKLTVELSGNKPLEYVPEMLLCSCMEGQFISSPHDVGATTICKIPSVDLEKPIPGYTHTYKIDKKNKECQIISELPRGVLKKQQFYLFVQGVADGDKVALRWKNGFTGKV